jgi:DNA-binding response OmpR family regulator
MSAAATSVLLVEDNRADARLLDLNLPDSQGLDTLVELQRERPGVPVVVLTGRNDEELAVKAVQAGAQDCLPKEVFDGGLLARLIRHAAVEPQWVDLAPLLLEDAVSGFAGRAEAKRIRLTAEVRPGLPAVHADPLRVGQVLGNLIDNALKFTPEGGAVRARS